MVSVLTLPILSILSIIIGYCFIKDFNEIKSRFKKIKKHTLITLIVIFLIGLYLRHVYSFCFSNWLAVSNAIEITKLQELSRLDRPKGYPFLLSVAFLIFGSNFDTLIVFNLLISSLSIISVFLLTYVLFKREDMALFSSAIFSLSTFGVFFSGTGTDRVAAVFFVILSFLIFFIALEKNSQRMFVMSALLLTFTSWIRMEYIIFFLVFLFFLLKNKHRIKYYNRIILVSVLLVFPPIFHYFMDIREWTMPAFSITYLFINLPKLLSIAFLIKTNSFIETLILSGFFSSFVLVGLIKTPENKNLFFPVLLALISFILYGSFYTTLTMAENSEYFLIAEMSLAILAGYGLFYLNQFFVGYLKTRIHINSIPLILAIISIIFIYYLFLSTTFYKDGYVKKCSIDLIRNSITVIDEDVCVLVDYNEKHPNFLDFMHFLLPNRKIVNNIEDCVDTGFYFKINTPEFAPFGNSTKNWEILNKGYHLEIVNTTEFDETVLYKYKKIE
jgi:hypothetical protein